MDHIDLLVKIERPIVFFDIESTGKEPYTDRIIELSAVKIFPDGKMEIKTKRINPEKPISPEATKIHGISDADVANEPTFKAISSAVMRFFDGCDLGGYNIHRFDLPMLTEEFKRAGLEFSASDRKIIDPQVIFHKREPRDLTAAYRFFCEKDLNNAHSAEADVFATIEVFVGQLKKYEDLPRDMDSLNQYCSQKSENAIDETGKFRWENSEAIINFGRNKGSTLKKMAQDDPGFLRWMINASFPPDATEIAKNALAGKFPQQKNNEEK